MYLYLHLMWGLNVIIWPPGTDDIYITTVLNSTTVNDRSSVSAYSAFTWWSVLSGTRAASYVSASEVVY